MADPARDQNCALNLSVTHEIIEGGQYQLSVFDRDTGRMYFHWALPCEEALSVATTMQDMISTWMLERYDRGNTDQETASEEREIWRDAP